MTTKGSFADPLPASANPRLRLLHRRRLLAAGVAAAGGLALPATFWRGPAGLARAAQDEPARGGTLTFASVDADTLDPTFSEQLASLYVFNQIFEPLIGYTADLGFEGVVAESWEVSEDGLEVTFALRPDLVFHDGTPVDAAAVKFTFDRAVEAWYEGIIAQTEVVDEQTVRFTLEQPYAPFFVDLTSTFFGIISPTAVEQLGDEFGNNPVGSGPFRFEEWIVGERISLVRNDDFQGRRSGFTNPGAPYLDRVVMRTIPEAQTLVAAFETGELNVATAEGNALDRFEGDPAYGFYTPERGSGVTTVTFTMQRVDDAVGFKPPFDDLRLRQAVAHAINADEIIQGVLGGRGVRNLAPLPVGILAWDEALAEEIGYPYDPDRANALLDEAGWTAGDGGVRQKDGQPLSLSLWTNSSTTRVRMSEVIQNQLAQVGMEVAIEPIELGSYGARLEDGESNMFLIQWGGEDPDMLHGVTESEDSGTTSYQDYAPEFAEVVERGRRTYDQEERIQIYAEAQRMFMADPQLVPLMTFLEPTAFRAEVKDLRFGPYGEMYLLDAWVDQG